MKFKKKYLSYLIPILVVWVITFLSNLILNTNIFGKYIYMSIDYRNQYYDALIFFRENYFSNPNYFTYYQGLGFGNEMLGFTNYYISSPLNFLLFLFPKNLIYVAIGLLSYLRLALGVVSFRYLIKSFKVEEITKQLFTITYVLSGFFIANTQNIIWLDMLFVLPLYIKGIYLLVNKNNKYLFIVSTTYMVISNFYMGYMLCLLSVPLVIYFYFRKDFETNIKKIIGNYFLSAIFIFLGSIFTLYTSYIGTSSSKGIESSNLFENPLQLQFTFTEFLSKFILGSNNSTEISQGSPSVWLPLFFILSFVLMLLDKNISKKSKVLNISLVTTLYFLMRINIFNLILHGFSNPVWYPFRQSFIFTIVLLLMLLEYFEKSKEMSLFSGIKFWYVPYLAFNILLVYVFLTKEPSLFFASNVITLFTLGLFNIVIFCYIKNITMKQLVLYMSLLTILILNTFIFNINVNALSVFLTKEDFNNYRIELHDLDNIDYSTRGLYNTNLASLEVLNNSMLSYYTFSSTLNTSQTPLFDALGVPYEQSIIVNGYRTFITDKLFGVSSVGISNDKDKPLGIKTSVWGDVPYLYPEYEKTDAFNIHKVTSLPIAFYSNYDKDYYKTKYSENNLLSQQIYINNLLDIDFNYFDLVSSFKGNETLKNPTKDNNTDLNIYKYKSNTKEIGVSEGLYYLYTGQSNTEDYIRKIDVLIPTNSLFNNINGVEYTKGIGYNYVNSFYLKDKFNYNIVYNDSNKKEIKEKLIVDDYLYKVNTDNIKKLDQEIIKHSPDVTNNNSGTITVTLNKNQEFKLLRTTVPYSNYWKAYHNQKEIKVKELDTFLALDIENLEGEIILKYEVPYLSIFKNIQIISWVCLIILIYINDKKRREFLNE